MMQQQEWATVWYDGNIDAQRFVNDRDTGLIHWRIYDDTRVEANVKISGDDYILLMNMVRSGMIEKFLIQVRPVELTPQEKAIAHKRYHADNWLRTSSSLEDKNSYGETFEEWYGTVFSDVLALRRSKS